MILIVTHSTDISADLVIRHLLALARPYIRLNTDELGTPQCFFGAAVQPELHIEGQVIRLSEVAAIWARRFALPVVLKEVKPEHADFVRRELAVVMDAFLEGAPQVFQINPSAADRLAGNRILQGQRAKQEGFSIPDTLVTQDRDAAREFLEVHPETICKALSFGRVSSAPAPDLVAYASPVPREITLDGLAACPTLLQQRIPARFDWRITTVGDRAFSACAAADPRSPLVDWRRAEDAATRFASADPPADVIERLLRLSRVSGIVYGAHDLIQSDSGEFFFLETNPAGQWGWIELTTGLPIGRAIADELAAHLPC